MTNKPWFQTKCQHCHTCGTQLRQCLDGEEWCRKCQQYRRYRSHGWTHALADKSRCLTAAERQTLQESDK